MSGMGASPMTALRSFSRDPAVGHSSLAPGTWRRVRGLARPYRTQLLVFLGLVVASSAMVVVTPVILGRIVTVITPPGSPDDRRAVVLLALAAALAAVAEGVITLVQRWYSARIGEGLIYDLRTAVFAAVQRQPVAFFTRAQTGALVTRLNSDVNGAQQAFTSTLQSVVGNVVTLVLAGVVIAVQAPLVLGVVLVLLPLFWLPARRVGRRLSALTRRSMQLNAEMGNRMTERFNVAGALLVTLFGRPEEEDAQFRRRAGAVRDVGVRIAMSNRIFFTALTTVTALATAVVYGLGGLLALDGSLDVGQVVVLGALLGRLYGPLTALANVRVDVMSALVSFERVFEVLDLPVPLREAEDAVDLPPGPLGVELEGVVFRYPSADDVAVGSLEEISTGDAGGEEPVLRGVDLVVGPGEMVALVGHSGAGKTTITSLVARLYDPTEGVVRVGGVDLREARLASVHARVGVVTQEAHLFHDTIRTNLLYARPEATEDQLREALRAAQVLPVVEALPEGLDTVVGDRGHRLSGGEKQRVAIARLLLKAPDVVVLDEATAHLDSESELAVQRALEVALQGRTSLVIAHRLSTVRGADRIAVVEGGRVVELGTHEELLAAGNAYEELYRTQFSQGRAAEDTAASSHRAPA